MARFTLRLFDGMTVTRDQVPIRFPSDKTRALFAFLVVEHERAHRRTELAGLFWSDLPEDRARHNLSQTFLRLRRTLGDDSPASPYFHSTAAELQFNLASRVECDVLAFRRLADSRAPLVAPDPPAGFNALRAAVDLYRGDFLAGLHLPDAPLFEEWLLVERESLRSSVLDLLDTLTQHSLAHRDLQATVELARRAIEIEPWRESAHRALMRALDRQGDRSGALSQFKTLAEILAAELGVEPDRESRALANEIATDRAPAAPAVSSSLPAAFTPFIGRENELEQLQQRLSAPDARLVTVYGLGGMGKTRLATACAAARASQYRDGVFFVPLGALTRTDEIFSAIADVLDLGRRSDDLRRQVQHVLRAKHALLVLDNFEHLLEGAPLLAEILHTAPELQVLVTSRERLEVAGEQALLLDSMDLPTESTLAAAARSSAVRLFVSAARRVAPDWKLNEGDLEPVLAICRHVAGMPLGIELAAARMELLQPHEIAGALHDRDLLTATGRDIPARHQSLAAILDWTWEALGENTRRVFCALAIFRGGFSRAAAANVAGAALNDLVRLAAKGLLRRTQDADGRTRYDLHELVREYAAARLEHSGALLEVSTKHAAYYLEWFAGCGERLVSSEPNLAVAEVRHDWANIRHAWEWSVRHRQFAGLFLAQDALERYAAYSGANAEGLAMLDEALAVLPPLDDESGVSGGFLRLNRGNMLIRLAREPEASEIAKQVLAHAERIGEPSLQATALFLLARAGNLFGSQAVSPDAYERALAASRAAHLPRLEAECLQALGVYWMRHARYAQAYTFYADAMEICLHLGDRHLEAALLTYIGSLNWYLGDYAQAAEYHRRAIDLSHAIQDVYYEGLSNNNLADALWMMGEHDASVHHFRRAIELAVNQGRALGVAEARSMLGIVLVMQGDWEAARHELDETSAWMRTRNVERLVNWATWGLALLARRREDPAGAVRIAREVADASTGPSALYELVDAITTIGAAQIELGELDAAQTALEQAVEIRTRMGQMYHLVEPFAGLAAIAVARGDLTSARAWTEKIWSGETLRLHHGPTELFWVYWTGYRVLQALDDPRAPALLETARAHLHEHAAHIADQTTRRAFLYDVPWHRALLAGT